MADDLPILIAGAGVGGLTLALCLARAGLPVRLLERAEALEEVGAGLQITPNAGRVLDALGLGPALDAVAVLPMGFSIHDALSGQRLARLPLGRHVRERWGAAYRVIHRADLQRVLVEAVRAAGVEPQLGAAVDAYGETDAGIAVRLVDGRQIEGRLLVGADGVRSTVRRLLGDGSAPRRSGTIAWRAVAPMRAVPHALRGAEGGLWMGPRAHLVHYPVQSGSAVNLVAVTRGRTEEGWGIDTDGQLLRAELQGWSQVPLAMVAAAESWLTWPLADREPMGGNGRVTLLGDAMHGMLPHLAQGAGMAIEDAAVLAKALQANHGDAASVLRAYEAARLPRVSRVVREARRNGEVYALSGMAAKARNIAIRMMGDERLIDRYDWLYGWQP